MQSKWVLILLGFLDVILGGILIAYPAATISFIIFVFGIYAVLQGVSLMVGALAASDEGSSRWWMGLGGLAAFLVGLAAFFNQPAALIVLIYFIAVRAIFVGIAELITAIRMRREIEGEFLLGLVGVLNVLFGTFILFYPITSVGLLVIVLGWYSLFAGLVLIIRGFFSRISYTT